MVSPRPNDAGLNLEDFRRLGVRPQEYRLGVIRQAAARSTADLAAQQLSAPTIHAGLQLSRVATSAYRLLDPRRRQDIQLRARIGRILPQTLSWASQTGFHNEVSDFQVAPQAGDRAPFARSSLSDAKLIAMLDLDSATEPTLKQGGQQNCASSLSDADLLSTTPMSRRVARLQSPKRIPWLGLAACGLACGLILGFILHRSTEGNPVSVTTQVDASDADSSEGGPSYAEHLADVKPTPDAAVASADGVNPNIAPEGQIRSDASGVSQPEPISSRNVGDARDAMEVVEIADPLNSERVGGGPVVGPPGRQLVPDEMRELFSDLSGQLPTDVAQLDGETATAVPRDLRPMPASENQSIADSPDSGLVLPAMSNSDVDYVPDLVLSDEELEVELEPVPLDATALMQGDEASELKSSIGDAIGSSSSSLSSSNAEMDELVDASNGSRVEVLPGLSDFAMEKAHGADGELSDSASPIDERLPVPSEDSIRDAWGELLQSIPTLKPDLQARDASMQLQRVSSSVEQIEPGSPEYWVALHLVAEAAWLVETLPEVEERLQNLVRLYDVTIAELMAQTFVSVAAEPRYAQQPDLREHLLECGLRLADRLLIESAPAQCDEVTTLLPRLVESGSNDADQIEAYIASFEKSSKKISKHAKTVARSKEKIGGPSVADTKVLGRYHCLMLRHWDVGLTWLTEASDSAISRAAKKELELPPNPTAEEVHDVAELWVLVAERTSGRPADSIRLHVLDLIRNIQPKASGLTKLNLARLMDSVKALIPAHLLPVQAAGFGGGASTFSKRPSSLSNRQSNSNNARPLDLNSVS